MILLLVLCILTIFKTPQLFRKASNIGRVDQTSNIGRVDQSSNIWRVDQTSNIGRVDQTSNIGRVDQSSNIGRVDQTSNIGRVDQTSNIGRVDQTSNRLNVLSPGEKSDEKDKKKTLFGNSSSRDASPTPVKREDQVGVLFVFNQCQPLAFMQITGHRNGVTLARYTLLHT